ncbi:hypothetical protein [Pseudoroseomonas ludipueritiae]|uniref:Uncharacterized protein n=1 Tax=Pseudoroseomonas ludipueritiae TaxID=198093 RepID=A0ABR7R7X6_9PROT|nr:hypothetical protein [Pseudoroseomonas ludipueritiae]MBC9177845.1 hypothetical protein [Pseudoroseomonas ludipueritiae]MCG7363187.1 hypothetical protein [Roseomonas sp. ACRSG]
MPFPVTVNGRTWTQEDFNPWAYANNFPDLIRDTAEVGGRADIARQQVEAIYAALLSQTYPVVAVTGPLSLSHAAHNGRILQVSGDGAIVAPWPALGAGFSCLILNLRPLALPITASGTELRHPDGHNKVRVNGMAALIGIDAGPAQLQLLGQTEA